VFSPLHFHVLELFDKGLEARYLEIKTERIWMLVGIVLCVVMFCGISIKYVLLEVYHKFVLASLSLKYIPTVFFLKIYTLRQFLKERLRI
jgi:hypothetical protein